MGIVVDLKGGDEGIVMYGAVEARGAGGAVAFGVTAP